MAESIAKHATRLKQVPEEALGAYEDGSAGSVEVLIHGDVDGVEQSGVLAHWNATIRGGQIESCAVEVETDPTATSPLGNALHLPEIEGFSGFAADGCFDLNGADRDRYPAGSAAVGFALEIVDGEGGLTGRERDKMEAAKCLAAIAAVVEQVALLLNQYAALLASEKADG